MKEQMGMMGGMNPMELMQKMSGMGMKMMGQMGEGFNPMEMCRKMTESVTKAAEMGSYATQPAGQHRQVLGNGQPTNPSLRPAKATALHVKTAQGADDQKADKHSQQGGNGQGSSPHFESRHQVKPARNSIQGTVAAARPATKSGKSL